MTVKVMVDHDHSYKLLFAHAEMVADLVRGFVPEPWVAELDFATLEKVSETFVSDRLQQREDDMVWRLRWKGEPGAWLYVYLLLEFQSTVDPFMAVRIMGYVALLYQDLIRRGQLTSSGRLPPVLPMVVYNGSREWRAARDCSELVETLPGGLAAYIPRLRYLLVDEARLPEAQLSDLGNLAAALFRLERSRAPEEIRATVSALAEGLDREEHRLLRRALTTWLRQVLLPGRFPGVGFPEVVDLEEFRTMLEETVLEWTEQWKREGLRAGRKEGRKEGKKEGKKEGRKEGLLKGLHEGEVRLLLRQLTGRFGPLPAEVEARVKGADADRILIWGERLLTAETLDQVFEG